MAKALLRSRDYVRPVERSAISRLGAVADELFPACLALGGHPRRAEHWLRQYLSGDVELRDEFRAEIERQALAFVAQQALRRLRRAGRLRRSAEEV